MAKRGPKPKPTALKLIEGNPGKRPLNKDEPKPDRAYRPRCPRGMSKVEQAKWRDVVRKLGAMRVLTVADLDAVEIYVRNWCAMTEALTDLDDRGKLIDTPGGSKMWNPSWSVYKHSEQVCRKLQAEFGMTPSSRTNIKVDSAGSSGGNWDDF